MGPALEDLRPYEQSMIPAMLLRRLRAALAVTPEETAKPRRLVVVIAYDESLYGNGVTYGDPAEKA
jgi:hypothetical protein